MKRTLKYKKILQIILVVVCFFSVPHISVLANEDKPDIGYTINYNDNYSEASIVFNFNAVATVKYNILSIKDDNGNGINIKNPIFTTKVNGTYSFHVNYQVKEDITSNEEKNVVVDNTKTNKTEELILEIKVVEIKEVKEVIQKEEKVISPLVTVYPSKIYISNSGIDTNDGSQQFPVATLIKAQELVSDGGTIYVMDDIKVEEGINASKNLTITSIDANNRATIKRTKKYGSYKCCKWFNNGKSNKYNY